MAGSQLVKSGGKGLLAGGMAHAEALRLEQPGLFGEQRGGQGSWRVRKEGQAQSPRDPG